MYDLPYHKAASEQELFEFVREHPFALVTGCDGQNKPVATQLPMFLEEREGRRFLSGHLMRGTDHHRAFEARPSVLVVFTSPNVYVSGSWYADPHTPSTWNYMSVHARGTLRFLGEHDLERVLRMTSLHFEKDDADSPTVFDNLPSELRQRLMGMILAFEVEIESLESVFKLSQERDASSYRSIIDRLREQGDAGRFIASEMEKRSDALFPGDGA
jgi:transcriptional regulator